MQSRFYSQLLRFYVQLLFYAQMIAPIFVQADFKAASEVINLDSFSFIKR